MSFWSFLEKFLKTKEMEQSKFPEQKWEFGAPAPKDRLYTSHNFS